MWSQDYAAFLPLMQQLFLQTLNTLGHARPITPEFWSETMRAFAPAGADAETLDAWKDLYKKGMDLFEQSRSAADQWTQSFVPGWAGSYSDKSH